MGAFLTNSPIIRSQYNSMASRYNTCKIVCSLVIFSFLVLWTICSVPAQLVYLYTVWFELSCQQDIWKYLVTTVLAFTTIGLICFIALSGGLIIAVQQKEYKIETLEKLISSRRRHYRRRTRDSIPTSQSLPSYNFDDASSPYGPPAYLDIIVEHTDRTDVLF